MKLNKNLELGVNAVNALKNHTVPVRTQDLAVEIGASLHFLEQVMRKLRAAGIVTVKRGPGGGHTLDKTRTVTAHEVATAVGRNFGTASTDEAPMSRLSKAITDAFLNTTI